VLFVPSGKYFNQIYFRLTLKRPDIIPESQYFPFYLAPGSGLASYLSNFTMQNLQIIELDQNRDPLTNPFQMTKGTLTFNVLKFSF